MDINRLFLILANGCVQWYDYLRLMLTGTIKGIWYLLLNFLNALSNPKHRVSKYMPVFTSVTGRAGTEHLSGALEFYVEFMLLDVL